MIKSFNNKALRGFWETGSTKGLALAKQAVRIRQILEALAAATKPTDMDLPGLNFHNLAPTRPSTYTLKVNGPWRITFRFEGEDATDVDLEQYH